MGPQARTHPLSDHCVPSAPRAVAPLPRVRSSHEETPGRPKFPHPLGGRTTTHVVGLGVLQPSLPSSRVLISQGVKTQR